MTARYVTLGCGRRITLRSYVRGWQIARQHRSHPDWRVGALHDSRDLTTLRDLLAEYRTGMHDRINRHLPWFDRGRKWDDCWQTDTLRAARDLNTPRLAIHWLPPHLRDRFVHRLRSYEP